MARTRAVVVDESPDESPAHGSRPSSASEVSGLPERKGPRLARAVLAAEIRGAREAKADYEGGAGRNAHRIGTRLRALYAGWADEEYGFESFAAFSTATFDLRPTNTYDFMRIAHHFGEAESETLGITRLRRILSFFTPAGVSSWKALKARSFDLPDGGSIKLGSRPPPPLREIEAAYRLLLASSRPKEPTSAVKEAERLNEGVRVAKANDDALADVEVRFEARDGKVAMRTGPLDREGRVALAKLLLKLDRER